MISERLNSTHREVLNILTNGVDKNNECWKRMEKP